MIAEPLLRGPRVVVRRATADDVGAIVAFYTTNEDHLRVTGPKRPEGFATEDFWRDRLAFDEADYHLGRLVSMFVFDPDANPRRNIIGTVNFSNIVRGVFQACKLGYSIGAAHEGKGLMYESLTLAIDYAFAKLNLHRIMANYMPGNRRSAQLLARLGFVPEGYARDYVQIAGRWQDHVLTALTNPNWTET